MGILVALAVVWWLIRLALTVVLTVGSLWAARRVWRRSAGMAAPAERSRRLRYLAVTVGLAAFGALVWMLLTPPPDFRTDLPRAALRASGLGAALHPRLL